MKNKIIIMLILLLTACNREKVTVDTLDKVPLCSSGKKVELDVQSLREHYPEEYKKLPFRVRTLGFRPMLCKPG